MARAVRYNQYGGIDVLQVVDVERPSPGPGRVLVRVKAAGINPGEASIRKGLLHERWPATFPSGQGSDLAGVVEEVGDGVDAFTAGDEVIGFTDERGSHAEFVVVPRRPPDGPPGRRVPWEVAGVAVRRRHDRVRGRARGGRRPGRHGRRLRRRRRRRVARRAAGQARRRNGDRAGQRAPTTIGFRARRDSRDLWRRASPSRHPRGGRRTGRRVHRHLRRRVRRAGSWPWACRPIGSTRSSTWRRSEATGPRRRATRPRRAPSARRTGRADRRRPTRMPIAAVFPLAEVRDASANSSSATRAARSSSCRDSNRPIASALHQASIVAVLHEPGAHLIPKAPKVAKLLGQGADWICSRAGTLALDKQRERMQ